MTIKEKEQEIIEEFAEFDDWLDKYEYIIDLGKELPVFEEKYKINNNIISGCQSQVWLAAEFENDKITYIADSDTVITKGIISLLIRVLSNETPDNIYNAELLFIDKIGLKEHLSPTRSNGLTSMVKQIKLYALAYKTKMNQS